MTDPIELFDAYLDGSLTDAEAQQLRDYVDESPEHARIFVQAICMDQAMYDLSAIGEEIETPTVTPASRPVVSRLHAALALAAAVALAMTLWFVLSPHDEAAINHESIASPSVALLTNMTHAVFAGGRAPTTLGGELPSGVLQLESGVAQVMFKSGAVVDLTGPCTFDMTEPNRGRLLIGTLEAYVPPSARGFTVDVGHVLRVIDLGTRFRLAADAQRMQVQVDEGHVQVMRLDSDGRPIQTQSLVAGTMALLSDGVFSLGEYTPAHQRQNRYINAVQRDAPAMYWPLVAEPGQTAWIDMGPGVLDAPFNDGAIVVADGPLGDPALHLNGTNELEAGSRRNDLVAVAPLTVETWLRLDAQARPGSIVLVSPGGHDAGWELALVKDDGQLHLSLDMFGHHRYRFDEVPLDRDRWMHIAVVLDDAATAKLYVDGKLNQSLAGPPSHARKPNTAVVKIGGWAAGPFFHGDLAHLAVYDRALETDRIQVHLEQANQP